MQHSRAIVRGTRRHKEEQQSLFLFLSGAAGMWVGPLLCRSAARALIAPHVWRRRGNYSNSGNHRSLIPGGEVVLIPAANRPSDASLDQLVGPKGCVETRASTRPGHNKPRPRLYLSIDNEPLSGRSALPVDQRTCVSVRAWGCTRLYRTVRFGGAIRHGFSM